MDFRIIKKIIYSDEYVRLSLKQHDELMKIINTLKLPLLSKITEFYGDSVRYGTLQLDDLSKEIDIILNELKNSESIKLLDNLKILVKQAKEEEKPIQVLTE